DFISKPISWGVLGHRARYILRASQAFQDLAKHQASLENAQRIARLGSWEWDLVRNEIYWSSETYRILDMQPGEAIIGFEPFIHRVHAADRAPVREAFQSLLKTGKFAGESTRIDCPDGSLRHIQLQGVASFDASGKVLHVSGTIQDVSELKQAEERIRHLAY